MARRRVLIRRAKDEALLRYGPEARALRSLLREVNTNLRTSIRAETGAAEGIRAAVKEARPEIRRSYADAGMTFQQADQDVAAAGGTSQASVREAAGAKRRLSESLAGAERDLSSRSVQAEEGRRYGIRNAQRTAAGERQKIGEQAQDLSREIGTFTRSTYRELKDADVKLGLEKRKLRLDIGAERRQRRKTEADLTGRDPKTGELTAAERERRRQARSRRQEEQRLRRKERKGGKGKPKFTPSQLTDNRAMWDKGKTLAQALKAKGLLDDEGAAVRGLNKKGVDVVVARGVVQVVKYGGVHNTGLRKRLWRDYRLKPKALTRRIAKPGTGGVLDLG